MSTEAIELAIRELISAHRTEFDTLVYKHLEKDVGPITMESIHQDNLHMWRAIADDMYPEENLYEGSLDD